MKLSKLQPLFFTPNCLKFYIDSKGEKFEKGCFLSLSSNSTKYILFYERQTRTVKSDTASSRRSLLCLVQRNI